MNPYLKTSLKDRKPTLLVHQSISDLYQALNLPIEQELEFTIHFLPEIHTHIPFQSPVFRAEYFSFVFIKSGKGQYTIDDQQFSFEDRTVYFTNPGHIKSFDIERSDDAYIITLTETFLRENVNPQIFDEFPFLLAEIVPPMILGEKEYDELENLYQQINLEFRKDSPYKNKILGNLFVVLLLKIKEQFWHAYDPIEEGDRISQIVKSFKQKLEQQFKDQLSNNSHTLFQVQNYARELNLHPNYLSTVIKSKTGKSVNQWINDKQVSTARTLLKTTSLTVKEISYQLGFSEPTHFNRFFKKHTGMTPGDFKSS
ncbi:MAG: AraC family transcriptional regulator [Cytophagales bacterium]|nr:AraC family transcriptional regulator [Cytophagales bacterium]